MSEDGKEKKKFHPAAWAQELLDSDDADIIGVGTKALLAQIVQLDEISNDLAAIANLLTDELQQPRD